MRNCTLGKRVACSSLIQRDIAYAHPDPGDKRRVAEIVSLAHPADRDVRTGITICRPDNHNPF